MKKISTHIHKYSLPVAGIACGILTVSCSMNENGTESCSSKREAPNILFIMVDDMGYGELSCYNPDTKVSTPNIDKICTQGVKMTQAYAQPVSSPTRSSFLTGYFPQNVGVYGNYDGTAPGVGMMRKCFAEDMQAAGYRTGWFGKWHQGWDVTNYPANNGFDVTYGFLGGMHDYHDSSEGSHYIGGPFAKNSYVFDDFKPVKKMKYLTEELTDKTIDFISNTDRRKPFFAYLAYNAPHTPFQAPEEVVRKYLAKGMNPFLATRCAMMDVLDTQVGRLLDCLEKKKLTDNTMVIFMSDNGPEDEYNSGGLRGTKMTVWEGGVRVPMIVSYPPRIPEGTVSTSICSIADLAATFLGMAKGDDAFQYGDGKNLIRYYDGTLKENVHDTLVFAINMGGPAHAVPEPSRCGLFGVRAGDWKLVMDKKREVYALYNLKYDPGERNDLSGQYPEIKEQLYWHGCNFMHAAQPACGKIRSIDTRKGGDKIKFDSLVTKYGQKGVEYEYPANILKGKTSRK